MTEQDLTATMRIPESLWKRTRIKAIRDGVNVSVIVRKALEDLLASEAPVRKARGKSNGEGNGQ